MQKKFIPSLQIETSRLGFGAMRLPQNDGVIDKETVCRMIDQAMAQGLTYFDTAYVYHDQKSELALKDCLFARYPRESFTIADKIPFWIANTEEDMQRIFGEMLERLGTDYIDFLLLHSLNADSWEKCKSLNANAYQLQLKKEGKIRFAGFSFHDKPEVLRKILSEGQWDFVQLQINYFDWDDYARENYEIATEAGVPIIVMEPVRGGALADLAPDVTEAFRAANPDWNDPAWALRFVADLDNVAVILSGMSNEAQIADNLKTFDSIEKLTDEQKAAYDKVFAAIKAKKMVPCTACRYCMPCPFGVNIPQIYRLYNDYQMFNQGERAKAGYQKLVEAGEDASQCQKCGACMAHCPQVIDTPELLPAIHELLSK